MHQKHGREVVPASPLPELRDVAPAERSAEVSEEDDQVGTTVEILAEEFGALQSTANPQNRSIPRARRTRSWRRWWVTPTT